jgi:hypothetical protein
MPRLFRIEFFTKDTRLGSALLALEGIAIGKPEVTPVKGATSYGNKIAAQPRANGQTVSAQVIAKLKKYRQPIVHRADIARWIGEAGGNPNSTGSAITMLKEKGLLKGQGIGKTGYKVIHG